jgi:beta-fructofuranosidase
LYYQHNPKAAKWDTMHWGHAVSTDLLHWKHRPIALRPTPGYPDKDGCWSGCMVLDNGRPTILYTGVEPQTQVLATSTDFETWEKRPQPVLAAAPPGIDSPGFRDPHVWREGDEWLMMIGAGIRGQGGCILLYSSRNLIDWTFLKIVHQGRMDAALPGGDVARGEMWECPDFFPVGDRHLLYVATRDTVLYWLGTWQNRTFTPQQQGVLLSGAHYAPKSFDGPGGRRMIWSWIREQRATEACLRAGWAGVMSLAIVPSMGQDKSLRLGPALEYQELRRKKATPRALPGDCFEMLATVEAGRPFALLRGGLPLVELQKGVLRCGRSQVEVKPQRITLHIFVDGSVIEVFANQSTVVAGRIYNTSGRVEVTATRNVECWELTPISTDRLTGV